MLWERNRTIIAGALFQDWINDCLAKNCLALFEYIIIIIIIWIYSEYIFETAAMHMIEGDTWVWVGSTSAATLWILYFWVLLCVQVVSSGEYLSFINLQVIWNNTWFKALLFYRLYCMPVGGLCQIIAHSVVFFYLPSLPDDRAAHNLMILLYLHSCFCNSTPDVHKQLLLILLLFTVSLYFQARHLP